MQSLQRLQSLLAHLNGLVWAMYSMCRTKLAHDVRLSLLKSRRGAAASASAGVKRAHSVLRGSMEKDSKRCDPRVQGTCTRLRVRQQFPDLRQSNSLEVYSYNN